MSVEGQITENEARRLFSLARGVPAGLTIVEIGTYRGRSTAALAFGSLNSKSVPVFAVDPHLPYVGPKGGVYGSTDQAALYANLTRLGIGTLVTVIGLSSRRAAAAWEESNIGLLFIDGDHHYAGVSADFNSWFPMLAPDAVIAFHDQFDSGVSRLIDEAVRNGSITRLGSIDGLGWFRKDDSTNA